MDKKTIALLCAFLKMASLTGCPSNDASMHEHHLPPQSELSVAGSNNASAPHSGPIPYANSNQGFHDLLLSIRAYANSGNMPFNISDADRWDINRAVNHMGLGDIEHYFIPSWIPEGFKLDSMSIHHRAAIYYFVTDGFDGISNENAMNTQISFSWTFGMNNAEDYFRNSTRQMGLNNPVDGIEIMYYRDYGTTSNPSANLARSYSWLHDGYVFRLDLPLWVIAETPDIHYVVRNSVLNVEVIDGEYYVEPASIALTETTAQLPVGETLVLSADVLPANATIKNVMWSSSDNSVATVSQDGIVTWVGAGTATIAARTVNEIRVACVITAMSP
jgi:hypothetical protein